MKRRQLIQMLGAAGLAASVGPTSGCLADRSQQPATQGSTVAGKVEFWTINLRKDFGGYIEALVRQFETAHPGTTVTWVDVPGTDLQTKYLAAVAAGNPPDLVNLDSFYFNQLAHTLSEIKLTDDQRADYQKALLDELAVGGAVRAVPWYNGGAPIGIYRRSLLDKAGFTSAAAPTTWPAALDLASKVHNATGVHGVAETPRSSVLRAFGVSLYDGQRATIATPEAATVLATFRDFYRSGAVAPGSTAPARSRPETLENGKIAMEPMANPARLAKLANSAPSVFKDLHVTKAVGTLDGRYLMTGQMTLAIPMTSRNHVTAAALAAHVTSAAAQVEFCKLTSIYPSSVSALKDEIFAAPDLSTPLGQARAIVVEEIADVMDSNIKLPSGVPAQLVVDFDTGMADSLRSNESPEVILKTWQDRWEAELAKAK